MGIELVEQALSRGIMPERILYTSFTRAAANEARQRAIEKFPYLNEDRFCFFRTLHSIGFRLLQLNHNSILDGHKLKEFAKTFNYQFSSDTLDKDIFQQEIIDMGLGTEADVYLAFDEWRKNKLYFSLDLMGLDFKQAYNEFIRQHGEIHSQFNEQGLRAFIRRKEEYKQKKGLWEFSDILAKVIMDKIPLDVDVVIADEHQDASPLIHAVVNFWSMNAKEVYLLGDPDQCLPAGTKIATPNGEVNIENLSEGSAVVVSIGSGYSGVSKVSKIHRNISHKLFITLRTKTGKELTLTADHRLFVAVPFTYNRRPRMDYFYVYLMQNDAYGWRIGTTNIPGSRLRIEGRPVPRMFLIRDYDSLEEARFYEALYSLKYGIPTQTFISHSVRQFIYGDVLKKLCNELGVASRVGLLASDLGINLDFPIWVPQSTTLAHPSRLTINVRMATYHQNSKRFGKRPYGFHAVALETTDKSLQDKLRSYGYKMSRRDGSYLAIHSKDFEVVLTEAMKLKQITGGQIRVTHTALGKQGRVIAGLLMPAGNVMRGFVVPILNNGKIVMDEVIDVKREFRIEETFDLDIEQYHNYIANGIMVHNCIYSFMAADPSIMIDWERDEDIVLRQSHRCCQAVHDLSRKITDRMKVRYHSDFLPTASQGRVIRTYTPDYDSVGSTIVAARTRYLLERHYDELMRLGLPFTARSGERSPLDRKEKDVVLTLFYLANGEQVSFDDIYRLSEAVPQKRWLEYGSKASIKEMATKEPNRKLSKASLPALGFTSDFVSVLNDREFLVPLKLEEKDKLYFRRVINKYGIEGLTNQPKLSIGTCHSFKGLEADRVILDLELTTRPLENLDVNPDSEHRVFYVGSTRAREEIQLLIPDSWKVYNL
jgi:DNA helicase-2/ATP-dependent DNA helicase PcrA